MKKIILTLVIALSVVSCSNEPLDVNAEANSTSKLTTTKTSVTPTSIPSSDYALTPYTDCNVNCIEKDSQIYFEKTDEQIVSWGGPNNDKFSKTVYIKYFNTETHFVLQVLSTEGFSDLVIDGVPTEIKAEPYTWGNYSYPLADGWQACDAANLKLQVAGNGPQGEFDVNYNLVGLCHDDACDNKFIGKAISCGTSREAEYTFTSKEAISNLKIQGGLTNFTGSDAVVTILGSTLTASQRTPGGSSNRVITVEGSIGACETITINIKWNSSNSGGVITGEWSASGSGIDVDPITGLTCN